MRQFVYGLSYCWEADPGHTVRRRRRLRDERQEAERDRGQRRDGMIASRAFQESSKRKMIWTATWIKSTSSADCCFIFSLGKTMTSHSAVIPRSSRVLRSGATRDMWKSAAPYLFYFYLHKPPAVNNPIREGGQRERRWVMIPAHGPPLNRDIVRDYCKC